MEFIKSVICPAIASSKAYFFVFSGNDILVKEESEHRVSIPLVEETSVIKTKLSNTCFLGTVQEIPCYCAHIISQDLPGNYKLINLRSLYGKINSEFQHIAGYARQIHDWNMNFRFCGRCGAQTKKEKNEHARLCYNCSLTSYPRISPAIITAVVKGDEILLAKGVNFPNKKMFSVLAGFVEPGENLEDCVKREVFEEAGIKVTNIQYFNSQPWPFPDSLMIGFTACYKSGDLSINTDEILEAGWFKRDALPVVPGKPSLARELIDWFVSTHSQKAGN